MADRWNPQVAVRFSPADLEALDRLVAARIDEGIKTGSGGWWSYSYRSTRSSVIVALVRAAAAKHVEDEAKKPKKPVAKKGGRR